MRLWLVAKGPLSLFSYWEFHPDEHPEAIGADGKPHFFLRIIREGDGVESTNEIDPAAGNLTIAANEADAAYLSEIGFYNSKAVWCFLAKSNPARTGPAEQLPLIAPLEKKNEPESGPAKKWSRAQEKRLNRILAAEIAQHREPKKRRAPRANAEPRRPNI